MNRIPAIDAPVQTADGELLRQFLADRDDRAFAALVVRHGPMVYGVCLRRLGQCQDAEDSFQAVFLALARQAAELADRPSIGPWLYTVARRVSGKALRSRRRRRWVFWGKTPEPEAATPVEVDVDLDAALATLSEPERSAVILCHLEGLSRAEAAQTLAIPEGTLSARLSRALGKLRRKLRKQPMVVLASAAAVMLPERLPASTMRLVHHWREGALEEWASPRALELYRKATPMRLLDRVGPAFAALAALLLVLTGATMGWRIVSAQPPAAANRAAGEAPASSKTATPPKSAPPQKPPVAQTPGKRNDVGQVGGMTLADAVKDFNERAKNNPVGKDVPPLTEDEVIAAIRSWPRESNVPRSEALYLEYQQVAESRRLPPDALLDAISTYWVTPYKVDVWWIDLSLIDPADAVRKARGIGYSLRIRDQKLRSRLLTAEEIAANKNAPLMHTYRLRHVPAADAAVVLNRLLGLPLSKPSLPGHIDPEVTADPRTNTISVIAPSEKHQSILKAVLELDKAPAK